MSDKVRAKILEELSKGDRRRGELLDAAATNYAALNRAIKELLNEGVIGYRFDPEQVFFLMKTAEPSSISRVDAEVKGVFRYFPLGKLAH